ncbi:MAG: hypothetical protein JWO36_2452 [Myxococcales bacterium]|nr:hypothetical protein [Myxococcales bacterium]
MPEPRRLLVGAGAINAAFAIMMGAFAAHWLRNRLDATELLAFESGARYQMYHALAMVFAGLLGGNGARNAGWIFQGGIVLFSGSLYLLAVTGVHGFGALTPIGGIAFLIGWAWLAVTALRA